VDFDHDTGTVRVDWHGYAPDQAATWADRIVESAYAHGFRYVEFVHGAADVIALGTPGYEGSRAAGRSSTSFGGASTGDTGAAGCLRCAKAATRSPRRAW
jgi:hypothetical protein